MRCATTPRSRSSSSTDPAPLLEIGRIERAHGIRGEVLVRFVSNRNERVRPGATYVTDAGELTIVAARPHGGRHLVCFEGILDRSAAESLRGTVLTAPPIDDPAELWVHDLVGSTVVDRHGTEQGVVTAVVDNPASDLLELDNGHLVPLTFVVEVDPGHTVVVDAPAGLFD